MDRLIVVLLAIVTVTAAAACHPKLAVPQVVYVEPAGMAKKLLAQAYADKRALSEYKLLNFKVKVTNASDQTLEKAELAYVLYGKDGAVIDSGSNNIFYLSSGQVVTINSWTSGMGLAGKISKYEFTFRNMVWGLNPELYSADAFVSDPSSPGEVGVAYFCFTAKIDYDSVKKIVSAAIQDQLLDRLSWEAENARPFAAGFYEIMVMKEYVYQAHAQVDLAIYYKDGEALPITMYFVLEDGNWRVSKKSIVDAIK